MERSWKMAGSVEIFDKLLRRNPYLPKLPWLRNALRTPYHWIISREDAMTMIVGKAFAIKVPPKYVSPEMENYEVESCVAMHKWLRANPGSYFVDIGCAFGFMSAGALFTDPSAVVIAIDSSIQNIGVAKRLCSLASGVDKRLELIRALIGSDDGMPITKSQILKDTAIALDGPEVTGDTHWTPDLVINLDAKTPDIPRVSLDRIFCDELVKSGKSCLIKCDVEGGEMIVVNGLQRILDLARPTLMLSVHPQFLPNFGSSVEEITRFLKGHNYSYTVIAVDHEEHWLCTPS
jgi:FkbM family methyltransferase